MLCGAAYASLVGFAIVWHPLLGVVLCSALLLVSVAVVLGPRRLTMLLIGALLVGYMFLDRSLAGVGISGVAYVSEAVLFVGIGCLIAVRWSGHHRVARSLKVTFLAFLLWNLALTVAGIDTYGVLALRDAAPWAYSAVAVIIVLIGSMRDLQRAAKTFATLAVPFIFWVFFIQAILPLLPEGTLALPGSDMSTLTVKPGSLAVHLAGIAALFGVGLHRFRPNAAAVPRFPGFWTWTLWAGAAGMASAANRGGLLAICVAVAVVALATRSVRAVKPIAALAFVALVLSFSGLQLQTGTRSFSLVGLREAATSIVAPGDDAAFSGSREWRLQWWGEIISNTVMGPFFWTGRGYGVNLADEDGFQTADPRRPLRSPHNVHLTFLARSGVPGFLTWVSFLLMLLTIFLKTLRDAERWSLTWRLNIWLFAYLSAALVNASFDVYLEGPQGAFLFWALVAALVVVSMPRVEQALNSRGRPTTEPERGAV